MTVVERPITPVCGTGFRGFKSRQSPLYLLFTSLVESARFGRPVAVQREGVLLRTYARKTLGGFSTGNYWLPVGLDEPDN